MTSFIFLCSKHKPHTMKDLSGSIADTIHLLRRKSDGRYTVAIQPHYPVGHPGAHETTHFEDWSFLSPDQHNETGEIDYLELHDEDAYSADHLKALTTYVRFADA